MYLETVTSITLMYVWASIARWIFLICKCLVLATRADVRVATTPAAPGPVALGARLVRDARERAGVLVRWLQRNPLRPATSHSAPVRPPHGLRKLPNRNMMLAASRMDFFSCSPSVRPPPQFEIFARFGWPVGGGFIWSELSHG